MTKMIKKLWGKLIEVNKKNNIPYDEWINEYIQQAGMILIFESVNKAPGKHFVYFYPNDPDSINQKYFHTSIGDLVIDDKRCKISTKKTEYVFALDELLVSESDKELLLLNVFYV